MTWTRVNKHWSGEELDEIASFQHDALVKVCEAYNERDWWAMRDVLRACTTPERLSITQSFRPSPPETEGAPHRYVSGTPGGSDPLCLPVNLPQYLL